MRSAGYYGSCRQILGDMVAAIDRSQMAHTVTAATASVTF
jgi:hypothetical protein